MSVIALGQFQRSRMRSLRGFTLIDVLVSISVIGVLIGILLPSLVGVTKTARRVACGSNVRQLGLGLYMYADDYKGYLAPSVFLPAESSRGGSQPQEMMRLRFKDAARGLPYAGSWDGLGLLFNNDYLPAPKIFYCHAHRGNHPFSRYSLSFGASPRDVISNYHYRGEGPGPVRARKLYQIVPPNAAIIADGMKTKLDYSHRIGLNVLCADQSVIWFDDSDGSLWNSLPDDDANGTDATSLTEAWGRLDQATHAVP